MADYHALPIALVGQLFAASKGVKHPQIEDFNPFQALLYQKEAKATLSPAIAKTFLHLSSQNQIPAWVLDVINIKLIRSAAS